MFLRKKWTMRHAIMAISTTCTIMALVLLTFFFYVTSHRQISEESIKESTETLSRMELEINSKIHSLTVQMQTIYTETGLMYQMRSKKLGSNDVNLKPFYWTAWKFADNRFSNNDGLVAVYIYDCENSLVSSYRQSVVYYPRDIYKNTEEMNSEAVLDYIASDSSNLLVTGYYNSDAEKNIVRLVLKLHDYSKAPIEYGYLVCDFDGTIFSNIMKKYISSDNVLMWLQPWSDNAIAMIGENRDGKSIAKDLINQVYAVSEDEKLDFEMEYDDFYLTHIDFDEYNLSAYMLTPMSLALATQNALFRTLIITAGFMGLFTLIISSYLARFYSKSVEDMQKTVYRIRNGETELRLKPEKMTQELELLGTEFNELLDQINMMISEKYENQLLMERTEYQALQAQINPHFLYNTLDTMSGIANSQNCTLVSGLCQSLSALFRYSLDISDRLSTMEAELVHVRHYVYVMNVRNGNSIQFIYDIDNEVLNDKIPRITLQPIVENSINHGLRYAKKKDKKITIRAKHIKKGGGNLLQIDISDNGVGMDTQIINGELINNNIGRIEKGESIGVLNVNARIKKAFGNNYGITMESVIDEGTRVTIIIPA